MSPSAARRRRKRSRLLPGGSEAEALLVATESRQKVAHGVSRGFGGQTGRAPEGRQNAGLTADGSRPFCRRAAARLLPPHDPRLTPWATLWRSSAASPTWLQTLLLLLLLLAAPAPAQTPSAKKPADKSLDDLDSLLKGDAPSGTLFRFVEAADPKQPLAPRLFWRRIPAFTAAHTTPVRFRLGGDEIIAPRQVTNGALTELTFTYPIEGRRKLESGRFVLTPGDLPLALDGGQLKSDHPALRIVGDEVQIRCAPVRFDGVDERGTPVPVRVTLQSGKDSLLREPAAFNPLVIWLPVGVRYQSSFGDFTLSPLGKVEKAAPEPGITVTSEGLRKLVKEAPASAAAPSLANQLWLVSHRGRAVFAPHEEPLFTVLVPRGFAGGEVKLLLSPRPTQAPRPDPARPASLPLPAGEGRGEGERSALTKTVPIPLGILTLPAVAQTDYDSRAFTLRADDIPLGDHELWVESGPAKSARIPVTIVPWEPRSSFFTHTTSHCTGQWPTNDAGLKLLADAGVQMVASSGFHSVLDTALPTFPRTAPGPAEASLRPAANDLFLERLLRHGLRSADLAPMRGEVLYLESLSYHHSYAPTVNRMVRKLQLYTQQTADYPSAWGVNYSWFPQLGGYSEGGVPTDAHVGDRNRVLGENLAKAGFTALTKEERQFHADNKFSSDAAARAKALELQRRAVAHWKAQQDLGWGQHNKLYNDAVREVRPDTQCLLLENAGHDGLKRTRALFGDMAASFYGTYTDFGDWPLSAGFTTDWARGNAPERPVWLTTSWGTSPEGSMKSLLHAFARGVAGAGVPMQEDAGPAVLARRAKGLAFVTQFGAIATRAQPDSRFAILSTASQQVFAGGHAQYVYHALYSHLTRLGCAPVVVDDVVAVEKGLPAAVKVLFLVRQQQPLESELAAALAAFQQRGGKVLLTGDCLVDVAGATKLAPAVKQLWELGGFTADSHANLAREFADTWRAPLTAALAQTGVPPLATTDPDRAFVLSLDAGPVRYAVVIADTRGKHSNHFEPTAALPVSLEGTGWTVRNLVTQEPLKTTSAGDRTEVAVDLITEPVAVLACYRTAPATLTAQVAYNPTRTASLPLLGERAGVRGTGATVTATVRSSTGTDLGPIPLRLELRDPAGALHSTLFRAAGEEARFHLGTLAPAGQWQLTLQEQLTGLTTTEKLTWPPTENWKLNTEHFSPVPDVHLVNEPHLRAFTRRTGEKLVLLEPGQEALLPAAKKLVERLTAAGQRARLWQLRGEDFDTIPVRWYPQPEDTARLQLVSAGQLVGWRGNLVPFIDKVKRAHVPERGGYAEDGPFFMVGADCVVFSGGRLAESLRAVTPWMNSPNAPGRAQGRLVVCFSPFAASKQVAALVGNDVAGLEKAADKLAELTRASSPSPPSDGGEGRGEEGRPVGTKGTPLPSPLPGRSSQGEGAGSRGVSPAPTASLPLPAGEGRGEGERSVRLAGLVTPQPVATPLRDFTPLQRTVKLLANARGQAAVFLDGKADTLAFVDESGRVTATVAAEAGVVAQARMDDRGRVWTLTARGTARDKAWHFENAHELTLRALAPDGTLQTEVTAYTGETHDLPPDHEAGLRIAPDGETYAFGRRASVLLGKLGVDSQRSDSPRVLPHPGPLPKEREKATAVSGSPTAPGSVPARGASLPLPAGEGRGEGERPVTSTTRYDDLAFVKNRFEVRNPRFPVGTTFSPDSRHVFFTMDTRPRFGGMGVTSPSPVGCEATLVDAQTGQRLWGLRATGENSAAYAALSGFAAVSKDAAFTALADYDGSILLVDKTGKASVRESVAKATHRNEARRGPPGGVGVWISDSGAVAAWAFRDALHISSGGKLARVAPPESIVAGGVSADGTLVFAACADGEVLAFAPDGTKKWSFNSGGQNPQLATTRANEALVANNIGELIHLDRTGKETRRVNLATAADRAKHPVQPAANLQRPAPPLEARDPGTLAVARAQLSAKQVAAWKPVGQGSAAFGREFFTVTAPIELRAGAAEGEFFLHLVYRRPEANRETTITTTGADGPEKFFLDLPALQFRVVDIPVRGPGVKVTVSTDGPLEVADCSLWSFKWPGGNKLYVAPAGGSGDPLAAASPKGAKPGGELNLDDLLEAGGASGKAKEARIYVFNPDPDQVKGPYLKPSADPMTALNGRRFGNGKSPDWVSGKPNYKGAWLTVDLGKPTPLRLVATYERVNRQSAVSANFALFSGFDPKENEGGELLATAVGSDQFWRIFPVSAPKVTVLGIHLFGGTDRPEGLSEAEAY